MIYLTATAKLTTTENCNFEKVVSHQIRLNLSDYYTEEGLLNFYCAILSSIPHDVKCHEFLDYSIPSTSLIFNKYLFMFELYSLEEDETIDACQLEIKTNCESNFKNAHNWKVEMRLLSNIHGEFNYEYSWPRNLNEEYNWDAFLKSIKERCCLLFMNTDWIV